MYITVNWPPTNSQSYVAETQIHQMVQLPNDQQVPIEANIEPQAVIQTPQVATTMESPSIQAESGATSGLIDEE